MHYDYYQIIFHGYHRVEILVVTAVCPIDMARASTFAALPARS